MEEDAKRAAIAKHYRKMEDEIRALDEGEITLDALQGLARELVEVQLAPVRVPHGVGFASGWVLTLAAPSRQVLNLPLNRDEIKRRVATLTLAEAPEAAYIAWFLALFPEEASRRSPSTGRLRSRRSSEETAPPRSVEAARFPPPPPLG